ncbi:MAG TPA: UDP-4-amino-4,6-dideoxy-N-acetyl-beta-L-altrosamine transaminase [Thermodesulfobacteriota bacterium]|nr:UDP-4-amino-4,6-dideoxy-N-acetyl-beta-L-altrosamine transaminase [Thermodesulfobacteriota bacterium]
MSRAISYGRQTIDGDDVEAVVRALTSEKITQGPLVEEFESELSRRTGARYAVACSSGTAALHLAYLAAGVGNGDGVVTSPITFLASANAAIYAGATPLFADIDPATSNIDPQEVEKTLSFNSNIKTLVPVHFAGLACDMESISRIASARGLTVIEDACHALGAEWKTGDGRWVKVGACTHSDMTVFSFHPVKSITTAEGGAVTTNDERLYRRLKTLRSHGVTREKTELVHGEGSPWYYEMHELGFNYRLSDIQSALGISQLKKLDNFMRRRSEIAAIYSTALSKYPFIKTPFEGPGTKSARHLYPITVEFGEIGVSRKELFELMSNIGINLQVHYIPVHLQPYYRKKFGYRPGDFPKAEAFYTKEVSLPIYPLLTDEEAGAVTAALISTLGCASAKTGSRRAVDRACL